MLTWYSLEALVKLKAMALKYSLFLKHWQEWVKRWNNQVWLWLAKRFVAQCSHFAEKIKFMIIKQQNKFNKYKVYFIYKNMGNNLGNHLFHFSACICWTGNCWWTFNCLINTTLVNFRRVFYNRGVLQIWRIHSCC